MSVIPALRPEAGGLSFLKTQRLLPWEAGDFHRHETVSSVLQSWVSYMPAGCGHCAQRAHLESTKSVCN